MPASILTTTSGIGIGFIAQNLAANCRTITRALTFDGWGSENTVSFSHVEVIHEKTAKELAAHINPGDKILAIEHAYGLIGSGDAQWYLMPMYESGNTAENVAKADEIISPTHICQQHIIEHYGKDSRLLPIPFSVDEFPYRKRTSVKRVLHNAGSLGQRMRKGTPAAIEIFQKSGVARHGVELLIRSWVEPPAEMREMIAREPDGIVWDVGFCDPLWAAYEDSDLLLHTAKVEGYGMPVPEAMACGCPVLCAGYAPMTEFEDEPDYQIPIGMIEPSPVNPRAYHQHVDTDAGASMLADICGRGLGSRSMEVRDKIRRALDWSVWRDEWEEAMS